MAFKFNDTTNCEYQDQLVKLLTNYNKQKSDPRVKNWSQMIKDKGIKIEVLRDGVDWLIERRDTIPTYKNVLDVLQEKQLKNVYKCRYNICDGSGFTGYLNDKGVESWGSCKCVLGEERHPVFMKNNKLKLMTCNT